MKIRAPSHSAGTKGLAPGTLAVALHMSMSVPENPVSATVERRDEYFSTSSMLQGRLIKHARLMNADGDQRWDARDFTFDPSTAMLKWSRSEGRAKGSSLHRPSTQAGPILQQSVALCETRWMSRALHVSGIVCPPCGRSEKYQHRLDFSRFEEAIRRHVERNEDY